MICTSTRPERRRAMFRRDRVLLYPYIGTHVRPSRYTPHIGKKQIAKAARLMADERTE